MQSLGLWGVATVGVLELGLFCWMVRSLRCLKEIEQRVGQLTDALSLLTETTETGFRASAIEIARLAGHQAASRGAASQRSATSRVSRARRRGRTIQDIAADERMSEGEVRLRLHLCEDPPSDVERGEEPWKGQRAATAGGGHAYPSTQTR